MPRRCRESAAGFVGHKTCVLTGHFSGSSKPFTKCQAARRSPLCAHFLLCLSRTDIMLGGRSSSGATRNRSVSSLALGRTGIVCVHSNWSMIPTTSFDTATGHSRRTATSCHPNFASRFHPRCSDRTAIFLILRCDMLLYLLPRAPLLYHLPCISSPSRTLCCEPIVHSQVL
jgi:hypothetical protein